MVVKYMFAVRHIIIALAVFYQFFLVMHFGDCMLHVLLLSFNVIMGMEPLEILLL